MASRPELQDKLEEIFSPIKVYFQPPEGVKMEYPCVVFSKYTEYSPHANDKLYLMIPGYEVTLIDYDPDSDMKNLIQNGFDYCHYVRTFISDNLYHDVYIVY